MPTLAECVSRRAEDDSLGLIFESDCWTWRQMVGEAAARVRLLNEMAVPIRDERPVHIGVLLENTPDFVFWLMAGVVAGAPVVGLNPTRPRAELSTDLKAADVDVLVTTRAGLQQLQPDVSAQLLIVDDADYQRASSPLPTDHLPQVLPTREATAVLMFSSGSTGAPKAVVGQQGRYGDVVAAVTEQLNLASEDVCYLTMPLFHGNALIMNLFSAMWVGATVAMRRKFSARNFSADIHRYGVTYTNYVGRALSYVLKQPNDERDYDSTLRLAYGTEASAVEAARFAVRFGCEVREGYGQSEGVLRINRTPDTPPGALGKPVVGRVEIRDSESGQRCPHAELDPDTGALLNPEAVGEIVAVDAAARFAGYYKNPAAMKQRVRGADYWTGDLGFMDAEGFVFFAGRNSDWLRVDGENFAAGPAEQIVSSMTAISACAMYGVPDPVTGDQVMLAIEAEGPTDALSMADFAEELRAQPDFGRKWWPALVRVIDSLPVTANNKVAKEPLRRAAWETADPVWRWTGRDYQLLDEDARNRIRQQFEANERARWLPARSQPPG